MGKRPPAKLQPGGDFSADGPRTKVLESVSHLGEFDPDTGAMTKPADPNQMIEI
jgi:hypothetical protein